MTDANATETQIDIDNHEMMTGTRDQDRAAEVRVGGETHEHVVPAQNIWHTVAQNHLPLHETGMARDSPRGLIEVMAVDMVAEAQII